MNDESEPPDAPELAPESEAEDRESPSSEPPEEPPKDPLEEATAESARLRDRLLRTAADFDNFRKRTRKEIREAEIQSREDLLRELLPIFDNLERAGEHAEKATDVQGLADGVNLVLRMFFDTLGKLDVHRVDSLGKAFDPSVHEAIQQMESTEHPPGTIAAEVQPGYRSGERLLRPAMVVVARAPVSAPPEAPDEPEPTDAEDASE